MKTFFGTIILIALLVGGVPIVEGQTLGQVLRATERRVQLVGEIGNVEIALTNEAHPDDPPLPSEEIKQIQWNGVGQTPTDQATDALPIETQVSLLRQAWECVFGVLQFERYIDLRRCPGGVGKLQKFEVDNLPVRIDITSFHCIVKLLAARLSQMKAVDCPILIMVNGATYDSISGPSYHPDDPPIDVTHPPTPPLRPQGTSETSDSHKEVASDVTFDFIYEIINSRSGDFPVFWEKDWSTPYKAIAPLSFAGSFQMYNSNSYGICTLLGVPWPNALAGLQNAGFCRWMNIPAPMGQSVGLAASGIFGGDITGVSLPGHWSEANGTLTGPDGSIDDVGYGYYFAPYFSGQNNSTLFELPNYYQEVGAHSGSSSEIQSQSVFVADFGPEFPSTDSLPPERPPILQITPDLGNGRLKLRLANDPANDCELIWSLPNASRHALKVRGNGEWEAVYSGLPEDREQEVQWNGNVGNSQGHWSDFFAYMDEWWQPVLAQLKTATYFLNLTQVSKYIYKIDCYRADQMDAKDGSGRYQYHGIPIESFTVENPDANDDAPSKIKITTNVITYDIVKSQTDNITWNLTEREAGSLTGPVLLSKSVAFSNTPSQVIDDTSVDGKALPTVTTTYDGYIDPLHILTQVESGGLDGSRSTTWTYKTNSGCTFDGQPISYRTLTGITQTGGEQPFSATYDDSELLTDYVSGPVHLLISYSGLVATRVEKVSDSIVSTLATTYTGGLTSASTTSGAAGAVAANTQYYSGTDTSIPWGLKSVRDFDGTLATYTYAQVGDKFVVTQYQGRASTADPNQVGAGVETTTEINSVGIVSSVKTYDVESGAPLDYANSANNFPGTPFPTDFARPLGAAETYAYDGQGRVTSHKDNLGVTTDYTRDALGRVSKVVREPVTEEISYNPTAGKFGRFITWSSAGEDNRTLDEESSPFGLTQTTTLTGPRVGTAQETTTVTRIKDPSAHTITTATTNSTTGQNRTEVVNETDLSTAISGNATEPWNISYTFPGNGWKQTVTHGSDTSLTTSSTCDALGRLVADSGPHPNGSGTVSRTYSYTGGQLTSSVDPSGTTSYGYQPDGSLQTVSLGGRSVSVQRKSQDGSQITWECTDATGDVLWQKIYHSASQATDYLPYGLTARKFSSTPSVSGNLFSVNSVGPTSSQSAVWRDGAPVSGSVASGASQTGWTATPNAYGDITSQTVKPGGVAGNALTTNFDGLGIPSTITGTIAANCTSSFDANGVWSMSLERHGHSTLTSTSAKGDPLENRGYGLTDGTWDPPTYSGSSFTKKLTTPGVGNPTFTWNLAGTLKSRQFPDGTGESFTYNANGGLQSWTTPKGPSFDFNPNIFGQPQKIGDAGNLGYDAAGRVNEVTTKVASSVVDDYTQSYTNGQPDIQEHIAGILQGAKVDRDYDDYGHLKKVTLPGGVSMSYVYGGTNGTISTVTTAGGLGGTWTDPNVVTGQPQNLQLGPLTTTTAWDGLGRVTGQSSTSGGSTWSYGSYNYDEDGHCYQVTSTPDGAWAYGYDATKGWLTTATQGARTFNYGFDAAGRISGNGTTDFRPGTRHNNPVVEISGSVAPGATVTINGAAATLDANHQFDVFTPPLPTGWPIFTIRGTLPGQGYNGTDAIAEETRQVYVPPAAEPLSYTDGSRSGDARWSYGFDTLDRMTTATESAAVPGSTGPRVIYCTYDLNGRRIEKKVVQPGQPVRRTTTLWDGWRPVMEIERAAETIVARRYYTWGPDVSGSIDGAAGIGGLLEVLEVKGGTTTRSLPIYDGVGNVVGLVDGTSGLRVATYQYGPFGENLGVWGDRASSCPFRYQTRLYDDETGLSYFGQRYYDAKTQAWLSRDPLRESGGVNLYAYCGNDPVSGHDPIGLSIELNLDGSATFYGDGYSSYRGLQDYLQTPLGTVTFILQNARAEHDDLNRAVGYLGEGEAHRLLQLQGEIPRIERFVTYETNRIAAAGQFGNTLAAEKEAASNTPGWSWLGVEGEIADIRAIGIGIGAIKNPRFGDYFAASLNSPLAYSRAATLGVEIGLSLTGLPEDSLAVNSGGPPLRFSRVGGSSGFVYASEEMMQAALRDPAIYGVKFRVLPKFNPALDSSFMGLTTGTGLEATVEIGPSAFVSRQELLDTIIHEETHIRLDLRTFRGSQRASLFQSARSLEEEYVDSVAGRFFRRFGGRE